MDKKYLIDKDIDEYIKETNYKIDKNYSLNIREITENYLRIEANRLILKIKEIKDFDINI
jgi:hypothetical protein